MNNALEYWGNTYTYDAWGNLTNKAVMQNVTPPTCGGENLNAAPANAKNQLPGYTYDNAGNMTHDATTGNNYSYDAENRISGAGYSYIYDADGNRVEKTTGGTSPTGTIYWYMSPGIVAESDLSGNLKSEYVFFNKKRVARKDFPSNAVSYYFSDRLATANVITDSAGNIKEDEDFYPWGMDLPLLNNDPNKYKFGGHEQDGETGLYYHGARHYNSALSRFMTPDWGSMSEPLPFADLRDPQSLNLYGYAGNNPLRFADPDGHDYHVCGSNGKDCADYTDAQYNQWLKDNPNVKQSPGGTLDSCGDSGCQKIGTASYFNPKDQQGAAMIGIGGPKFIYAFMKEAIKTAVIGGVVGQVLKGISEGLSVAEEVGQAGSAGWPGPGAGPQVINGITYTEHALERMAPVGLGGRGVPPSVVENAIKFGTKAAGKYPGTVEHVFENVTVITNNAADKVITVIKTGY